MASLCLFHQSQGHRNDVLYLRALCQNDWNRVFRSHSRPNCRSRVCNFFSNPHAYNVVVTAHGLIMIFSSALPTWPSAAEQLFVLAAAGIVHAAYRLHVPRRRFEHARRRHRMDALPTVVDRGASGTSIRFRDLVASPCWSVFDTRRHALVEAYFQRVCHAPGDVDQRIGLVRCAKLVSGIAKQRQPSRQKLCPNLEPPEVRRLKFCAL